MHLLTLLLCVADLAKSRHCFFAIFSFNFHMWLLLLFFFLCVVGTTPRATLQFSTRFRITSVFVILFTRMHGTSDALENFLTIPTENLRSGV